MQAFFFSLPFGSENPGRTSKFIFFLFVFGVVLFCGGFLLSIFGFQTCQSNSITHCSLSFKIVGPSLAVIGLASVLLARSRARLELRRRELEGDQTDPDSFFLCGESRQFIQFLIFGFLFVTSGILISVLGVWIPGCNAGGHNQPVNGTVTPYRNCGFLSLQIMGPLIVLVGLCCFVVAHIKKKHNLNESSESSIDDEQQPSDEPYHITVGDAVIMFPPPPPPYFSDPLSQGVNHGVNALPDHPPSYNSIFNRRAQHSGQGSLREREDIYTIGLQSHSSETYSNPYFSLDPPPKYEEKDPSLPDPAQTSSPTPCSSSTESSLPNLAPQQPPQNHPPQPHQDH
ncbi:transmembrane protein 171 [Bombina bombina]|uniref:transmembrane protein 171 n=1 Tax=Bombina bombina TaxID=8345 RepID=UPI00235A4A23|nr:transmembrane protein 171 [Bombina bombina]